MPSGDAKAVSPDVQGIPTFGEKQKVVPVGSHFFMPGLQFTYSLSDMMRVGISGYYGLGEFTKTFDLTPRSDQLTRLPFEGATKADTKSDKADTKLEVKDDFKHKQWIEHLSPKATILAVVEPKVYENDSFSLSLTVGVGATSWKHFWSVSDDVHSFVSDTFPSSESASVWALSGLGLANIAFNLGDVATFTLSGGYAMLGSPKGFDYGKPKSKPPKDIAKFDPKDVQSSGFIAGVSLSKEF